MLDAAAVRRALTLPPAPFYVYVLHRPGGEPFYVGKGVKLRVLMHDAEARTTRALTHKLNLIRALHRAGEEVSYSLDSFHDDERAALARERALIAEIGRHDLRRGPLTNQTDGGEGTSNPSEESRQRRRESLWGDNAEDPERQAANRYFQELTPVRSVPIKPAATFKRADGLWKNDDRIGFSKRQAGALVASAIANRVLLEPGALIPRRLTVDGVEYIIENGVGRDMVSNGMVVAAGAKTHELLALSAEGFKYILASMDRDRLVDAGILDPAPDHYRGSGAG